MSGLTRTGTSVSKSLVFAGAGAKTWQHNRGVKALAVEVFVASSGARSTVTVPTQPDVNSIVLTASGAETVNVLVCWDVPTTVANSLRGVKGVVAASNGFV